MAYPCICQCHWRGHPLGMGLARGLPGGVDTEQARGVRGDRSREGEDAQCDEGAWLLRRVYLLVDEIDVVEDEDEEIVEEG